MIIIWNDILSAEHLLHNDAAPVFVEGCELVLHRIRGLGMPVLQDFVDKGADQDGETLVGGRLKERFIEMIFTLCGEREDIHRAERAICEWFNPGDLYSTSVGSLRVTTGVIREIEARFYAGLDFDEVVDDNIEVPFDLTLICPDPVFYDPVAGLIDFDLPSAGGAYIPIHVDEVVTVEGDRIIYPVFTITCGDVLDQLKIETFVNADLISPLYSLDFGVDSAFVVGEIITIDLRPGRKTVVSSVNGSIITYLSSDSNVFDFGLLPSKYVLDGENTVRVSGYSAGLTGSNVLMQAPPLSLSGCG